MSETLRQRDYAISIVRILATASIFIAHILQYYNHLLAWWFNVGVQIFLVMSGYLYGLRGDREPDDIAFYKRSFPKILLEYYLVVIPVMLVQLISEPGCISADRIYKILFTYKTLDGGQHLWFIPYILICYLLTPAVIRLFRALNEKKPSGLVLGFLGLLALNHVLHDTFIKFFDASWINCYIIGLFLGFCTTMDRKKLKSNLIWIFAFLAITFNALRIYIIYFSDLHFDGTAGEYFMLFCNMSHALQGTTLFFGLTALFAPAGRAIQKSELASRFYNSTDSLCYDIYLVHHFFILGSVNMMTITNVPFLNVVLVAAATIVLALLVRRVARLFRPAAPKAAVS